MINPQSSRCKLRVQYSKKEDDLLFKYPLGVQTKCDGMLMANVFCSSFIKTMEKRGYDPKTLRFSINIDWKNPLAKDRFKTIYEEIRASIPKDYLQMSLFPDQPSEGGQIKGADRDAQESLR